MLCIISYEYNCTAVDEKQITVYNTMLLIAIQMITIRHNREYSKLYIYIYSFRLANLLGRV